MRWPSFLSRKSNPANRMIMLGLNITGPDGIIPHKNFAWLSKHTYERNPTVFGCISTLAAAGASVPWVLYEFGRGGSKTKARRILSPNTYRKAQQLSFNRQMFPTLAKTLEMSEIETHPLLKLIEQPNPEQAQMEFTEQLLTYLLLSGNGYERFLSPQTGPNKNKPLEIWNWRPDRVEIAPADDPTKGLVGGYYYTVNGRRDDTPTPANAIIHHKFVNPTDDFYGMSPLQAAIRAWQTENIAQDWNYALLNNAARPSGAIIAPTVVGDDTYKRLKAELSESSAGSLNTGTPMFLEGGMKWEAMGLTPMEMDFLAGLRDAAIRICRVYHLAPEIIGVPDAKTYNSLAEARKAMWNEGVMPLLDRLRDSYNQRLVPLFGDRLFLDYDRDQIDAIQEDQAKVWDKLNRTRFLSTNEKRVAAGYATYDDPEGLADIPESILNPTPGATGAIPGQPGAPADSPSSLKALIRRAVEEDPELSPEQKAAALEALEHGITTPEQQKAGQALNRKQKQIEAMLRKAMGRNFKTQGADLAAFLRAEISKL
jgi:HK97 family phage portal protein